MPHVVLAKVQHFRWGTLIALAAATLFLSGCTGARTSGQGQPSPTFVQASTTAPLSDFGGPVPAPAHGLYLGAFDNAAGNITTANGSRGDYSQLQDLEGQINRKLAIDLHYTKWTGRLATTSVSADLAAGRVPLISWQCGVPDAAVASGADDGLIAAQARAVAALHRPVMIRWFWEVTSLTAEAASFFSSRLRDRKGQSRPEGRRRCKRKTSPRR